MNQLKLILASLLLFFFISCSKSDTDNKYPYKVTYMVISDASKLMVAYYDNGNVTSDVVQSGWSKEANIIKNGYATITVTSLDGNGKMIKAQIIRDGIIVKEAEGITISLTYN